MKRAKKIISLLMVVLFTASLGYFTTLTPTGAWLYDFAEADGDYTFGTFDVTSGQYSFEEELVFDATTKFNDYDTEKTKSSDDAAVDFDNAVDFALDGVDKIVYKKDITVTNSGNTDARIYFTIDVGVLNPYQDETNEVVYDDLEVRYFCYAVEVDDSTSIRDTMEARLKTFNSNADLTVDNRMSVLTDYQNSYMKIPAPVEGVTENTITYRILIWIDHDDVGDILDNTDTVQTLKSNVRMTLTAIQDTDAAIGSLNNQLAENWADVAKEVVPVNNVYTITTAEELAWIALQVNSIKTTFSGSTIRLANDIDLGGKRWTPIGGKIYDPTARETYYFFGEFDGEGHTISNMTINSSSYALGLFGYVFGGTIKNLGLINPSVLSTQSDTSYRSWNAAALVSFAKRATISNCYVRGGSVTSRNYRAAGLIGNLDDDTTAPVSSVTNCYVQGTKISSGILDDGTGLTPITGGLVGVLHNQAIISNCYTANITMENADGKGDIGSIVGLIYTEDKTGEISFNNVYTDCPETVDFYNISQSDGFTVNEVSCGVVDTDTLKSIDGTTINSTSAYKEASTSKNNGYPILNWE